MTTNFALSLSFEGIELLHRVQHGWQRVGRADVEDENLDAALTELRAKAEALEPDGLCTKLIIPLDQIKYIAIDSTQTTEDDIYAELDGATPYSLQELVIDFERFGGRTHIAAVARETLIEAETFAHAHGFNPVCFVAVPEPFTFQKEVFFGATSMMRDVLGWDGEVERDPLPVMVVGTRIKSRLLVFDLPEEAIPPSEDDFNIAATRPKSDQVETTVDTKGEEPSLQGFDLAAALAPFVQDQPDDDQVDSDKTSSVTFSKPAETENAGESLVPDPNVTQPAEAAAPSDQSVAAIDQPSIDADMQASDTPQDDVENSDNTAEKDLRDTDAPQPSATDTQTGPSPRGMSAPEPARVEIPENLVLFAPPLVDPVIAEYRPPAPNIVRSRRQRSRLIALAPPNTIPPPKLQPVQARPIPAPSSTSDRRRPGIVAGVIAASLVLIGLAAWALLRGDSSAAIIEDPTAIAVEEALQEAAASTDLTDGPSPSVPVIEITALISPPVDENGAGVVTRVAEPVQHDSDPQILASAAAPDVVPGPIEPAPEPPTQEQAAASVGAPILRGRVLSPADAARIYDATGVWQRAPRFVDIPGTTTIAGMVVPKADTVPGRLEQPAAPVGRDLATDLSFLSPADPPAADVAFPVDADGFILATPEGTQTPEGAVVFDGLPDLAFRARPELTQEVLARMALLAPANEGVVIVAGRPDVVPPLRPSDAALPDAQQEDVETAVANAADTEETTTPGGVALSALQTPTSATDPAIAGARPQARPSDLASTAHLADPGTPDITAIIAGIEAEEAENAIVDATPQAVVASLRPSQRPNGFDRIVAAARAQTQQQQAPVATPAPATAAPVRTAAPVAPQNYAPVPGGVARAATQDDAIRLRQINLIGVYGRPNARRALVRLSNGRYVRVEVGSSLDGGQVTAIGESALNYVKRGRTFALELPSG
ncbi:MAG: hypothetical protein AAFQ09_07255 [Pseudomonadota bacterium]